MRMLVLPLVALRRVRQLSPAPLVVHLHDPELLVVGQLLRLLGYRVVFDVHENIAEQILDKRYLPPWARRMLSWAYRHAEGVLLWRIATVHVLEAIARRYRQPKVVLRNLPRREAQACRHEGPRWDGPYRLIYVGEISRDRGALLMIQVTGELVRRGLGCRLQLIGPIYEAGLVQRMEQAIVRAGLEQAVHVTGKLPYEQAMAEVAAADVGLCLLAAVPNYLNSLPTKVFEYMRAGVPVVASDFECWQPYIRDTGAGLQVPTHSVPAIADAVEAMLLDPQARRRMGAAGLAAVAGDFSWDNEEPKLLAFYQMLHGQAAPTPAEKATRETYAQDSGR
jgi:glycosyltransferase involved in cell wall biosynthesis